MFAVVFAVAVDVAVAVVVFGPHLLPVCTKQKALLHQAPKLHRLLLLIALTSKKGACRGQTPHQKPF